MMPPIAPKNEFHNAHVIARLIYLDNTKKREAHRTAQLKWRAKAREEDPAVFKRRHTKWRKANQDYVNAYQRGKYHPRVYGDTLENLFIAFGRQCNSCGSTEKLCIDHCHETNEVRGILCDDCNKSLGILKENPERIAKLGKYAERCPALKSEKGAACQ